MEVERDVPATTISIAFHMGARTSRDFFRGDMTSDLLAGGDSARLVQRLVSRTAARGLSQRLRQRPRSIRGFFVVTTAQLLPDTVADSRGGSCGGAALPEPRGAPQHIIGVAKNRRIYASSLS